MSGTRILSLLGKITVLLVICCCCLPAQAKYGGGTGGPNDPYLIYTAGQMNEIGLSVNWGDLDKYFKLMVDIDLGGFTGTSFNIIGYFAGENSRDNKPFTGVFDGNGHTIANFTYNSNDRRSIGLFGYVSGENAEIKNLGLIDPNVDAGTGDYVGSLVGSLREGAVTGCYVQGGSVKGDNYVGGLVGTNSYHGLIINGTITNCYSTAGVSGNLYVGGLVGLNHESTITNCCSTASVAANRYVGGLVGRNCRGTITNCYSTAPVAADSYVGGLVGYNEGQSPTAMLWAALRESTVSADWRDRMEQHGGKAQSPTATRPGKFREVVTSVDLWEIDPGMLLILSGISRGADRQLVRPESVKQPLR
jgi:hypothetical protein